MASKGESYDGWQERLPTVKLQAEYFLLKFTDVSRESVFEMVEAFKKHDSRAKGELQEDEALRLLESRKETKRFVELRDMIKEMDFDGNRQLSFLEWACAYFSKSWKVLHTPSSNQAEIDKAIAKMREAEEREALAKVKIAEDERIKKELEEKRALDHQQTGIKGAAMKFHYKQLDNTDQTQLNADRIKTQAAARIAKRDKLKAEEDKRKAEKGNGEDIIKAQEELKKKSEEEERLAAQKEAERKIRVQASLRAKFGNRN